jgi:hypothetical protein
MIDPQEILKLHGSELHLTVQRSEEAIERDGERGTISREAFEDMAEAMKAWLGSRLYRYWGNHDKGAHKVEIQLKVILDDESDPLTLPVKLDLTALDGSSRKRR